MEYSVNKLSMLAGVSTRTLRYYDQIGLLEPKRVGSNGYRVYGQGEVDLLQQILFFRELGFGLSQIKGIVRADDFDRHAALEDHLSALQAKRNQLDALIANVEQTILAAKGEISMNDQEKFEGFKQKMLDENEQQYGKEIREKYGEESVAASNQKFMGLSKEEYDETERLSAKIAETLKAAMEQGDPRGEMAKEVCRLHKEWLCFFWKEYSKEAHVGLANMYVEDSRFQEYYEKIAPGCTEFLRDAIVNNI